MLLLGTQILAWYWVLLLTAVGAGVAVFRVWRSYVAPYGIAQILDRRFGLKDSLSTAWFLSWGENARTDSVAQFQIAQAEELARSLRVENAFPIRARRAWAVAAALAAVALGMFALRYLVTSSLSLRQSLIPIHFESVFERSDGHSLDGRSAHSSSANHENARLRQFVHENVPTGDANQTQYGKENSAGTALSSSAPNQSNDSQAPKANQGTNSQPSEDNSAGKPGEQPDQTSDRQSAAQGNSNRNDQSAGREDQSPGLMNKMKDALSSLMAKMHPGQNSQSSTQDRQPNSNDRTNNPNTANKGQAGQQQNSSNQQASQEQNSSGQAQGQTKEKAQTSLGQSSDQSAEHGSDSRSGVGRQDGDKGLREADQLQAMGKLEEIIGKRSESLSGEMMVETPSNNQQLKTAYSQHQGHHVDLGGEINRDEIPLMYRQYVREYMEQVRKQSK